MLLAEKHDSLPGEYSDEDKNTAGQKLETALFKELSNKVAPDEIEKTKNDFNKIAIADPTNSTELSIKNGSKQSNLDKIYRDVTGSVPWENLEETDKTEKIKSFIKSFVSAFTSFVAAKTEFDYANRLYEKARSINKDLLDRPLPNNSGAPIRTILNQGVVEHDNDQISEKEWIERNFPAATAKLKSWENPRIQSRN